MKLGVYEDNNIYNVDCYQAIKNLPDKSIDLIYTDVPYQISNIGGGKLLRNGKRQDLYKRALVPISKGIDYSILDEFCRVLKYIYIYIWCSKEQIIDLLKYFVDKKHCYFEILVWCKANCTPFCNNSFLPNIEYCLFFREPGCKLNDGYELKSKWYLSTMNKEDKELFNHPTIKPLDLVRRHILHATVPDAVVLDPFIGSGTTAVACKESGRKYIGFEIDENYFKIAKDRLDGIDATGQMSLDLFNNQLTLDIKEE